FPEISFRNEDILKIKNSSQHFDIITSTLTMHHFTNDEILDFLRCFDDRAKLGWVINDLQRSRVAALLFRGFSGIFMKTEIARYDGLVSIGRAFKKKELITFARKLGLENYQLRWRWAFRYLWIVDSKA
ncbi:MAG: methyltransferase, partial [Leeuwenhoekiella sp.]